MNVSLIFFLSMIYPHQNKMLLPKGEEYNPPHVTGILHLPPLSQIRFGIFGASPPPSPPPSMQPFKLFLFNTAAEKFSSWWRQVCSSLGTKNPDRRAANPATGRAGSRNQSPLWSVPAIWSAAQNPSEERNPFAAGRNPFAGRSPFGERNPFAGQSLSAVWSPFAGAVSFLWLHSSLASPRASSSRCNRRVLIIRARIFKRLWSPGIGSKE